VSAMVAVRQNVNLHKLVGCANEVHHMPSVQVSESETDAECAGVSRHAAAGLW